jgi:hypothetical protein
MNGLQVWRNGQEAASGEQWVIGAISQNKEWQSNGSLDELLDDQGRQSGWRNSRGDKVARLVSILIVPLSGPGTDISPADQDNANN